jgi:hypothetical protein
MRIDPALEPKGFFTLQYVHIPLFPTLGKIEIRLHPLELAAGDAVVLRVQFPHGQKTTQMNTIPVSEAFRHGGDR